MNSEFDLSVRGARRPGSIRDLADGRPALLVSVRSATEAIAALRGGCDILDVKEPRHGALGMAAVEVIEAVIATRDAEFLSIPVSVALGELCDLALGIPSGLRNEGISYCKFGTRGLQSAKNLGDRFDRLQTQFARACGRGSEAGSVRWIAVAYADWELADAPRPLEVAEAAVDSGCAGLLIDTFDKTSGGLFHSLSHEELLSCAEFLRDRACLFALAGRLSVADVERTVRLRPDIVGIRSAACRDHQRDHEVDADAVGHFREALACAVRGNRLTS